MKLVGILICIVGLTGSFASVYSQQTKLNVNVQNMTVKDVLKQIEDQSEYTFMYNASKIDVHRTIDLNVEERSVEDILKMIFARDDVSYKIMDRHIIIISNSELKGTDIAQQNKSVSGKITDPSGQPLPGVSVVIKDTSSGTITNSDGVFILSNVPSDATLIFSFVGMKTQEILVAGKDQINVVLKEETFGIEEVVAVGYGTMKKGELTSAVSNVKSENFVKGAVSDAAQLLTGKVAGLSIIKPTGKPTDVAQITLRGVTTLMAGTQPLVIIDGIPGGLSSVSPEDIETIDVLKDGSAAAIYGTRGTNGVILITTKKVTREMAPTIEYSTYASVQQITKRLDFMSADEYRQLAKQGKPGAFDNGASTDWLDEITQVPISHDHNLSIKGGKVNSNYIVNLNYKAAEGIMKKTDNDVFTTRLEVNHAMFDNKLKINANILGRQQKNYNGWDDKIYRMALFYNPTSPLKDANGKWFEEPGRNEYENPVALLEESDGDAKNTSLNVFGSVIYNPISDLTLKLVASHSTSNSISGNSTTFNHISAIRDSRKGTANRYSYSGVGDLLEATAQYVKSIKNHNITALAGYSWDYGTSESFSASNYNFPSDKYSYNNLGAGDALLSGKASMASSKSSAKLVGYFLKLNYNYMQKYMLMASIRHEGSSKFGADHKWGNFPAVSVGWNVKKESFMDDLDIISNLKLRAGFGITGTAPSSSYLSQSRLSYSSYFYYNGAWTPGIAPLTNSNPDLRWEKKEEVNLGLDFAILNDRISGSVDVYKRTTKDLLWNYNVPSPPYLYSTIVANAGTMENKGIEIQLSFIPVQTANFKWVSTINYSTNTNTLTSLSNDRFIVQGGFFNSGSLGEPIQTYTHRVEEGGKIGNFYSYKAVDIDSDGHWIIMGADGKPKPVKQQAASDRCVTGNGLPKHYASWNNTLKYKNFDLEINMRGAFKFQILSEARMFYETPVNLNRGNILSSAYHNVFDKRPLYDLEDYQYLDYYLENGDYWKIDNITVGYNFDLKDSIVKKLRIYASGLNLATFTGYSGIDPEVNVLGLTPGIDYKTTYPSVRTFAFGANITF